jgi:dihydroorotate dehydrogenase
VHYFYFSLIGFCRKYQDSPLYLSCLVNDKRLETEVFGLKFKNPGLAAGFDKDASCIKNCPIWFWFYRNRYAYAKGQDGNPKDYSV